MVKFFKIAALPILCLFFLASTNIHEWQNLSNFSIDEHPSVKIDTTLLGVWKAIEDSDKANFFYVQSSHDVFGDTFHYAEWMNPDEIKNRDCFYYITYMDAHGRNSHYEKWSAFPSKVGNASFLNIGRGSVGAYFFVRILDINKFGNRMVLARMSHKSFELVKNVAELRKDIEENINNPLYYSDTLHFYKVNNIRKLYERDLIKLMSNQ